MTLYESAGKAVMPWNSLDAAEPIVDALPQQKIEICLCCPYCADSCDFCDGDGNPKQTGRAKRAYKRVEEIDTELLRDMMRLRKCNKTMCQALGVSKGTLIKAKKMLS